MAIPGFLKVVLLGCALAGALAGAGKVAAQTPWPPERETINSQTVEAAMRGAPSPGYVPSRTEIHLPARTVAANMALNVYLLIFDPMYDDGRSLTEYAGWNDPDTLTGLTIAAFQNSVNNQYGFQVAQRAVVPDFPLFRGGTRLTQALYEPCREAFKNRTTVPDYCDVDPGDPVGNFDPAANLQATHGPGTVSACQALQDGTVDEVWVWAMPGSNAYEWYVEDPASLCPGVTRQFAIMFYNYERGLECSLEAFGHRAERIMMGWTRRSMPLQVAADFDNFSGAMWRYYPPYRDYSCPAAPDATHPEVKPDDPIVGNAHFPPNAYCHYQYNRDKAVWSDAEDWKSNYPNLTGQKTLVNRETWGCPAGTNEEVCHANYLQWWFNHWPNRPMTPGSYVSWWEYVLFTVDRLPVMLLTMHPFPNDHTVPPDAEVYTSYTWPMVPESVNSRTFAVFGAQTGLLDGTYTQNGVEITFTPSQPLHAGELVYASVTRGLETEFERNIARPWVWQFQAKTSPAPGTFMLNADVSVGVNFSDLVVADVNGDGLLDVLTVNTDDDRIVALMNTSGGSYSAGLFSPYGEYVEYLVHSPVSNVTVGDLNGDGALDMVATSNLSSTLHVLLNNGSGLVLSVVSYPAGYRPKAPALADVDGDGDLDVLFGNSVAPVKMSVLKNDGNGVFSGRKEYPCYTSLDHIKIGDMDGDGDLDAVLFEIGFGVHLMKNDGTGAFSRQTMSLGGEIRWLDIADVDGDSDLDVLVANAGSYGALSVLLNNGDGTFPPQVDYPAGAPAGALAVADVEGDGDLDALVIADGLVVFVNDGQGVFTQGAKRTLTRAYSRLAVGDVDGDGDLDALALDTSWDNITVFNNAAAPELRIVDRTPSPNQNDAPTTGVFGVDFNQTLRTTRVSSDTLVLHGSQSGRILGTYSVQDGVVRMTLPRPLHPGELVQASATTAIRTAVNLRMPMSNVWQFRAATEPGGGYFGREGQAVGVAGDLQSLALGDVDGDSDLDIAAVRAVQSADESRQGVIYFNDGHGGWTESSVPIAAAMAEARLGDMDGNGDLDMIAFVEDEEGGWFITIFYNDGHGGFADEPFGLAVLYSAPCPGLELGDVNGDGDMDVVVACSDLLRVYMSEPSSFRYSYREVSFAGNPAAGITLGDVDGDGDLDLVLGSSAGQSQIYFNDGRGYFGDSIPLGSAQAQVTSLDVGDLNGDGDLDIVTGQNQQSSRVYLNDGDGSFDTVSHALPTTGATTDVVLGDVDGDGDLDIAFAFSDQPGAVYLNNGDGTFASPDFSSNRRAGAPAATPGFSQLFGSSATTLALGDVTGDGSLDLLTAGSGQPAMLYVNHHRLYLPLLFNQHVGPCYDAYEVDDTFAQANPIPTDGTPQVHTFHRLGDEDWVSFTVDNFSVAYNIETLDVSDGTDTVIYLYDSDGTTLLDWNDDATPGAFVSRLRFNPYHSGTFYLQIKAYDSEVADCEAAYSLRVTGE